MLQKDPFFNHLSMLWPWESCPVLTLWSICGFVIPHYCCVGKMLLTYFSKNYSELSVSGIKLSQLQKPWPSMSRGQAPMGVWVEAGYMMSNLSTYQAVILINIIFIPGVLSYVIYESTLTFLLFKCQFNWFPSSGTIVISHGLDKSGLLSSSSPCSQAEQASAPLQTSLIFEAPSFLKGPHIC